MTIATVGLAIGYFGLAIVLLILLAVSIFGMPLSGLDIG